MIKMLSAFAAILVLASPGYALASTHPHHDRTQTSTLTWAATARNVALLAGVDPATAQADFGASSFGTSSKPSVSPVVNGMTATPVLRYASYAQFAADLANNAISPVYHWVLYDPETWSQTPQAEADDPWTYLADFVSLAHANGFKVILTPARDLGNDKTSVHPRLPGETLDQWFVRTGVASAAAAAGADVFILQDQANTLNLTRYDWLFSQVSAQVSAANAACEVLSGLSTNYGNASQMAAAAQSVPSAGFYVTVSTDTIGKFGQLLQLMH